MKSRFNLKLVFALLLAFLAAGVVFVSMPANAQTSSPPSATELSKYLIVGMGLGNSDTVNIQNAEESADQEVVSTSSVGSPSQIRFKYTGGLSLYSTLVGNLGWSNLDPNHPNDTVGVPDRLVGPNPNSPVAPLVFEGIDFSGNIALTAGAGDFNTSNVDLYASIGIHCADTVANCRNGASNSDWIQDATYDNKSLGSNGVFQFNPAALKAEIVAWRNYINGLTAEATIVKCGSQDANGPANPFPQGADTSYCTKDGEMQNSAYGKGGQPVVFDLDRIDQANLGNSDGVAVIDVLTSDKELKLDNTDWILKSVGQQTIAIIRLKNNNDKPGLLISNGSILYGDPAAMTAPTTMGAIFAKLGGHTTGNANFSLSNAILSGIALWDLGNVTSTTVNDNGNTEINIQNGQGCAQFVGQTILHGSSNRWNRCAPAQAMALLDFGDLPDTGTGTGTGNYQTTLDDNGPRHTITGPRLGAAVDGEADGWQSPNADGDDLNGATPDDEDGVTIPALSVGETATVVVYSSAAGKVNAFFDWNNDGDFLDAGEVIAELSVNAGNNNLSVPVPAGAVAGTPVGARFRISTVGGLTALGAAPDGEVEDYLVTVRKITITADPYCLKDAPWVQYTVTAIGFTPGQATIEWIDSDDAVVLTLNNQPLTGDLLWPEAAVDGSGYGSAWPGWNFQGGQWVQIATKVRPQATVRITVNPTAEAIVTYPPATLDCAPEPYISLGNLVFLDTNVNGKFDGSDTGIDDVVVELWSPGADGMVGGGDDTPVDWDPGTSGVQFTKTTSGGGWYLFPRIPSGKYYTKIQASEFGSGATLDGYVSTPGAGADDTSDQPVDENGVDDPNPALNGIVSNVVDLQARNEVSGEIGPLTGQADSSDNLTLDFGVTSTPLAILLAGFDAASQADHVLVAWEAVSEASNAGFNLYRSLAADGERTLLGFMPSQSPGSTLGAAYSFQDFDVAPGQTYWYRLEALDLNGAATLFDPVSVTFAGPTAVTLSSIEASPAAASSLPLAGALLALLLVPVGAAWARRRA